MLYFECEKVIYFNELYKTAHLTPYNENVSFYILFRLPLLADTFPWYANCLVVTYRGTPADRSTCDVTTRSSRVLWRGRCLTEAATGPVNFHLRPALTRPPQVTQNTKK